MRKTWESSPLSRIASWKPLDEQDIWANVEASEGIFHPTGSTRMGTDAANGVVDKDLYLFGVPNIQLLATSVLPTGGGANPTMMLLLLGMRCVDQHRRSLQGVG
jgi:choline dehydrogenase-like flavoprotein